MDKVIALRFETKKEVQVLRRLLNEGMFDIEVSTDDLSIGKQISEQLDKCIELFEKYEQTK